MCNDKWVTPAKSLPKGTMSLGASFPLMLQLNVIHLFLLHKVKNPFTERSLGAENSLLLKISKWGPQTYSHKNGIGQ